MMMRIPRTGRMTARATAEEEICPGEGAKTETTNGHPQRDIRQLLPCHGPHFRWQIAQAHPNHLYQAWGETSSQVWWGSWLLSVTPTLDDSGMTLR